MEFENVIGLEVHVELLTETKIFCGCRSAFGGEPNTRVCPVCLGHPGTLPVLNRKVAELAATVGLALHCEITEHTRFDRKNYFYPDNPQNYQISQLYAPLCTNGWLSVKTEEGEKRIRIHEIHMEEDAGKLIHDEERRISVVDYNRAGVPLIEIVTEPDMRSAEEVTAFLEALVGRIRYVHASDCRLNEGSLRVDVNLSIREKGSEILGTRTEMKNLNSFRAIRRAIAEEGKRQAALLADGEPVIQETRRWEDAAGASFSMRSKEDVRDYRYFPEPDIPLLHIEKDWIKKLQDNLPEFREEKCRRFQEEYALSEYDASLLTDTVETADFFEKAAALSKNPKKCANWLLGENLRLKREQELPEEVIPFTPGQLAGLIRLTEEGKVNSTSAKEIFFAMFTENADPKTFAKEQGMLAGMDETAISRAVKEVIDENPEPVRQFLDGKEKVLAFLIGQTMKKCKGRGDPAGIRAALTEELKKRTKP